MLAGEIDTISDVGRMLLASALAMAAVVLLRRLSSGRPEIRC